MFVVKNKKTKTYLGGMGKYRRRRNVESLDEAHVFKNKSGAIMAVTAGFGKNSTNGRFLEREDLIEVGLVEKGIVDW